LEEKYAALEKDKNTLARKVKELYRENRDWEKKDVQQLRLLSKYSDNIDELKEDISELKTEKKRLELLIKGMPEKLVKLERETNDLRLENATLHYNIGVFHTQRQEYTQAITEFRKALKLNANDPSTHYNLGIIYSRYIIDEPKAIVHFKHYLALAPNDKDAQKAKEYLLLWGTKENIQ